MTKDQAYLEILKFILGRLDLSLIDLDGEMRLYDRDSYLVLHLKYEEREDLSHEDQT